MSETQVSKITIATRRGAREIAVERLSDSLAIHRTPLVGRGSWTITHLLTGFSVCVVKSRQIADLLFDEFNGLDWNFRSARSKKRKTVEPQVRSIMERVTGSRRTVQGPV